MPKKGKKGVEQRTKGNVKAASSGRMTELMGGDSGFIGFEAVSFQANQLSVDETGLKTSGTGSVTGSFQTALKQMGKRDTTTKMKALNEFINLCGREPVDSVVSCLKLWPLMYGKVSTDNDHRVRDLSHVALKACGLVVKKHLGPHVRSIMGAWVSGMCDPHSHTAQTAQSAFTDVFPPEKQMEVFKFALKDIVSFIHNLVLVETSDTYTDPKIYPEDERVERYERAVSMAIGGIGFTLKKLGSDYLYEEGVAEVWQGILKEGRLWKLSRHKNPLIRSALFGLICSLAGSTHFLSSDMKQFCSIVFGSLSEKDSLVIGPLWDAIMFIMDSDQGWPGYVNIQKALLPGLWSLLEGGGSGNGGRVFPCLLPLINGLVRQVYVNDINFSLNFLQRLNNSFKADSVRISVSESEAVMNCLKECFILLLKLNQQEEARIQLLKTILDLFDVVLSDDPSLQYIILTNGVATVIINGLRVVANDSDTHSDFPQYCQECLIEKISLSIANEDSTKIMERIGDFLVTFHAASTSHTSQPCHTPTTVFILPVICKACSLCLLKATPTRIHLLQRLVSHYSDCTDELVTGISQHIKPGKPVIDNQLDHLVDHMISLCDSKELEPLLVDSVVSLLISKGEINPLIRISKEKADIAPLILKKVAEKGYTNVGVMVDELEEVLVPAETAFKSMLCSSYYRELLAAMLTVKGIPSLMELSMCGIVLNRLCTVLMEDGSLDSSVVSMLAQLDGTIIKKNDEVLTQLMDYILCRVLDSHSNNEAGIPRGLISCFTNIVPHLPNKDMYVSSVASKFLKRVTNAEAANEVLWLGVCYRCLHYGVLNTFESVYRLLVTGTTIPRSTPDNEMTNTLPTSVFQMFCDGQLLFTPPSVPSPFGVSSTILKPLFPCLITGICLTDDNDILQVIAEDRFETNALINPSLTVEDIDDDVIIPALFYMSAISIYSNKGSVIDLICQSAIQRLLDNFNSYSKLVEYLIQRPSYCESPVWNLCLNTILHISQCNDDLLQSILSHASELRVQLVFHKVDKPNVVEEILKQNPHDPCIVAGCLLLRKDSPVITGAASLTLSTIVERHNDKELTILDDDTDSSRDPMVFSVLELMVQLVKLKSTDIEHSVWEFIMCQSVSMVQLLIDTYKWLSLEGVVMLCRGLSLCCEVESSVSNDTIMGVSVEWREFFLPTIQDLLLPQLLKIKGTFPSEDKTFLHYYLCRAVIELSIQPSTDKWEELVAMVSLCWLYFEQVTGFVLAQRVLKTMTFKCAGDETEGTEISSVQAYISSFLFNFDPDTIFDASIDDLEGGMAVDQESHHQQIVSYLLLWMLICEIVGKCDIEARVVMTEWIKEKCQLNSLLKGMFPYCSSLAPQQIKGVSVVPSISLISNAVYFSIAQHLPPMLRQWYNSLDKQAFTQVMNFTSKNVTPRLWTNEVKNIHSSKPKASDLEVKVYSTAMEVFVAYRVDEFSIELSVSVPECYPLIAPAIKEGKRAKVDINLWRKWLLQLSAFIANQNGSILEGLMVWKSNLDKHFAGLEDCMICFSVIHGSNYSLPKMCCRTCKKKFHSTCLYKWFNTSAKSTCPLCRNVF